MIMLDDAGNSDEGATDTTDFRPQEENVTPDTTTSTAAAAPPPPPSLTTSLPSPPIPNSGVAPGSSSSSRTTTPTPLQQLQLQLQLQQISGGGRLLQVVDGNDSSFQHYLHQAESPINTPGRSSTGVGATAAAALDDNSRYQFMSEPSVSEEGSDRIIAPHRLPAGPNAFRRPSLENDNDHGHRYRSFHGSVPNSPGNTSLSSWDTNSPARPNVQLHFATNLKQGPALPPVTVEDRNGERRIRVQSFPLLPRQRAASPHSSSNNNHNNSNIDTEEDVSLGIPSLSASNNIDNFRGGAAEPSGRNNSSSGGDSDVLGPVLAASSAKNNSKAERIPNHNHHHVSSSRHEAPSINMAFSDSEDDTGDFGALTETNQTAASDEPLLDWEAHHQNAHAADDERTHPSNPLHLPPSSRIKIPRGHHRRSRSGDAAAASLATGGNDWKGMTKDNIPIPEGGDETDDSRSPVRTIKKQKPKNLEKQTVQGHAERHSSQPKNHTEQQQSPSSSQYGLERRTSHESITSSQSSSRLQLSQKSLEWPQSLQNKPPLESQSPQKSLERQNSFQSSDQRQSSQVQSDQSDGFVPMEGQPNPTVYPASHTGAMPPPPPPLPFHMYGGSPMMGPQQIRQMPELLGMSSNGRPPPLHIPSSPRMGGYPQMQTHMQPHLQPPPTLIDPHLQVGPMPVPYVTTWGPPSPSYYGEPSPLPFPSEAMASFATRNSVQSLRRDSDRSFPFVEDVGEDDESVYSEDERPMSVSENRMHFDPNFPPESLQHDMQQLEQRHNYQKVMRPSYASGSESPFANLGKKCADKAPRAAFMPNMMSEDELLKYPTYVCPRCKTRQREFFTVSDAPKALAEPSNYLALYFGIYVIASLFIFGLEEGWQPLDWYVLEFWP